MKLLVLVGPTAVGKTAMSLEIAERFGCEIISGDSMQVYRGMDIGTAKASPEERKRVPHHMIDILDPDESFSVSDFQKMTKTCIREIHERGRLPFIVGGTGLYIESVCYDFRFSEAGEDPAFREQQKAYAKACGSEALHRKLREIDPPSAERIHPRDLRRIIRALEVHHLTGRPLSEFLDGQKKQSPYELCIVGLTMDRTLLYKRIEERVDEMMRSGLVREVQRLLDRGVSADSVSMQALGYKEIIGFLSGEYTLEEATELLKRNTRRFAKRQLSWFRRIKDIEWVDVTKTENFSDHLRQISVIITRKLDVHGRKYHC